MQDSIESSPRQNDRVFYTESPSNLQLAVKKRKNKLSGSRKTNEELIKQSEEELMNYVDTVDERVKGIMQAHETQFLAAYQSHTKKVRDEMEEIKRKALSNASSEQVHMDQIESLNKQLTAFRDQSLKLFENIIVKDQQIKFLKRTNKDLTLQRDNLSGKIYLLTKRNRQLQFSLNKVASKLNSREGPEETRQEAQKIEKVVDKSKLTHHSRQQMQDQYEPRPYTTAVMSNNKLESSKAPFQSKKASEQSFSWLKKKIDEKMKRNSSVDMEPAFKTLDHKQLEYQSNHKFHHLRKGNANIEFKMSRRKSNFVEKDLMRLKCMEVGEKSQMQKLFCNCVESIKRQIIRRNHIPSLNYFKSHGPKNFVQFKQIDYYALLQILLTNDVLLKRLYDIIFIQ